MSEEARVYRLRTLPKDLGVALLLLVALGLGLLLLVQTTGRVRTFDSADAGLRMVYPAGWLESESLQEVLLKVEDPQAASSFKTTLTVERRDLDPQNPPTLQTLLDRRVQQRSELTSYHFLSESEATVGGAKSMQLQYAYVVQPLDEPRRASLPVVVRAREYIVVAPDRTYYITLAAPESEFERASLRFDRVLESVQLQ